MSEAAGGLCGVCVVGVIVTVITVPCVMLLPGNAGVCSSNPCQNGGSCSTNGNSYSCLCPSGWTGSTCAQSQANPCSSFPCENGGTCTPSGSFYYCTCDYGWTGTTCTQPNPCSSFPCKNGGTCTPSGSFYYCTCDYGWTGTTCTQPLYAAGDPNQRPLRYSSSTGSIYSPYYPNSYQNNVDCQWLVTAPTNWLVEVRFNYFNTESGRDYVDVYNGNSRSSSYIARLSGYYSNVLQYRTTQRYMLLRLTSDSSTTNRGFNATYWTNPYALYSSQQCYNGGICTASRNSTVNCSCLCLPGWTGPSCAQAPPQCEQGPCENGGTCFATDQTFKCNCPFDWFGPSCNETNTTPIIDTNSTSTDRFTTEV